MIVQDSQDLPKDWKNISLREMFQTQQRNKEGCSTDDKVQTSGDKNSVDDLLEGLNESSFDTADSPDLQSEVPPED